MEVDKKIRITLVGREEDGGDVRFDVFIQQLELIKKALTETRKLLSDENFAYFKVSNLSHNSPASVELVPVSRREEDVEVTRSLVDQFFDNLDKIQQGVQPEGFTHETYEAYRGMSSLQSKGRLSYIEVSPNGSRDGVLLSTVARQVSELLGDDIREYGEFSGRLEFLNLHKNNNTFYLYPTLGSPMQKLKCKFRKELKPRVIEAIDRYVTVSGILKFKANVLDGLPHELLAHDIEIHPQENELPKLSSLLGIAPDATGDIVSEDFIRKQRDEW